MFYSLENKKKNNKIEIIFRRGGRVVDSSGLENRYSSKQRTIEGSNPSLSFFARGIYIYIFYFIGFVRLSISILKGNGSARGIAEPEQKKKGSIYNESKMKIKEYFFFSIRMT